MVILSSKPSGVPGKQRAEGSLCFGSWCTHQTSGERKQRRLKASHYTGSDRPSGFSSLSNDA
ncbi:hypothetical protein PanWU01x14_150360, partial [Parasponia andersonii]